MVVYFPFSKYILIVCFVYVLSYYSQELYYIEGCYDLVWADQRFILISSYSQFTRKFVFVLQILNIYLCVVNVMLFINFCRPFRISFMFSYRHRKK